MLRRIRVVGDVFEIHAIMDGVVTNRAAFARIFPYDWGLLGALLNLDSIEVPLAEIQEDPSRYLLDRSTSTATVIVPPVVVTARRALALAILLGAVERNATRNLVSGLDQSPVSEDASLLCARWEEAMKPWRNSNNEGAWEVGVQTWTLLLGSSVPQPQPVEPEFEIGGGKRLRISCVQRWDPRRINAPYSHIPVVIDATGTIRVLWDPNSELGHGPTDKFRAALEALGYRPTAQRTEFGGWGQVLPTSSAQMAECLNALVELGKRADLFN